LEGHNRRGKENLPPSLLELNINSRFPGLQIPKLVKVDPNFSGVQALELTHGLLTCT
jgi:hypothetical protein